jgi:heat shock protein HspQ
VYDSSLRVYDGVDPIYNNTKIDQVNDDTKYDYTSIWYKNLVNNDETYMTTLLILYKNDVSAPL